MTSRSRTADAIFLSDPHFDPFRLPSKIKRLQAAPVSAWSSILTEPPASNDAEAFAKLQADCSEKGVDAENDLFSSVIARTSKDRAASPQPDFVLVSGDLVVHKFPCRYRQLLGSDEHAAERFAAKTVSYVAHALHQRLPETPIYIALGNNDTGCEDYRLDENGVFFHDVSDAVAEGWLHVSNRDREHALADFRRLGSYSLPLPSPMEHGRLIVLDDLFASASYKGGCGGPADPAAAAHLVAWLQTQLTEARHHNEKVWVLAHIPFGVDPYHTFLHPRDLCHGDPPAMFLSSEALTQTLLDNASLIPLVITGHTHVDEMHAFTDGNSIPGSMAGMPDAVNRRSRAQIQPAPSIVIKTVPSISPISNNPPSLIRAAVDPHTGIMIDYQLMTASASTGSNIHWSSAYRFQSAYHEPDFTPASVADITNRFAAGAPSDGDAISNYQDHFATGIRRLALQAIWPQYVCSMRNNTIAGFQGCVCKR